MLTNVGINICYFSRGLGAKNIIRKRQTNKKKMNTSIKYLSIQVADLKAAHRTSNTSGLQNAKRT